MSNRPSLATRPTTEVLATLLVGLALLMAALLVTCEVAAGMFRSWNDARLAPSAALLQGFSLYSGPADSGPIWSWIYGPVAPLVYLPAALLPTPASAVAMGLAMTAAMFVGSARWLLRRSSPARGLAGEATFAALILYTLAEPALRGAGYGIHADAPAIALAAVACAAISDPSRRTRSAALSFSALACVLAVATKQVLLPLPFAIAAFLAWAGRRPQLRIWLLWLTVWAAAATLGFGLWFGLDPLFFNLVTLPAAHPWQWGGGGGALARAAAELGLRAWPLLFLLLFELPAMRTVAHWRDQPRTLLIVVGLALSAGGVLTRVKVGADVNAHAFGLFFLAIAAAGALADACGAAPHFRRTAARATLALGLGVACILAAPRAARLPELLRALPHNPETTGLALARQAPDALYLPAHPLVTLYADQRASHVSYGIFDRALAGRPVSAEHFSAFTAPNLAAVGLWATENDPVLSRFPTFTRRSRGGPQGRWLLLKPADPSQSAP